MAKLICFYDDNGISIDGSVAGWFTDDTPKRFEAYGWHVIPDVDGHDVDAVDRAIGEAHSSADRPTLICCKTTIGKGSPNRAGTDLAHGQALGEKEVSLTRAALGWTSPPFEIPPSAYEAWNARECGALLQKDWNARFAAYRAAHPALGGGVRSPDGRRSSAGLSGADRRADRTATGEGRIDRDAQGFATGDRSARADAARADRRVSGSDRLGVHQLVGKPRGNAKGRRQLRQFRRARIRDERHCQWACAARRIHSLCRDLSDLFRLRAQRGSHGSADEASLDLRLHPRFDRPGRRRTDASVGRARGLPATDPEPRCLAALRYGRIGRGMERSDRPRRRARVPSFHAPGRTVQRPRRRADRSDSPRRLRAA